MGLSKKIIERMIFLQLKKQLSSLGSLLLLLNNQQYNKKIIYLGNASIGSHTRHIIELLRCVTDGYNRGTADYLNRVRSVLLETNKTIAKKELDKLVEQIRRPDRQMKLIIESNENASLNFVTTTFYREIVYNTEHAIHHLALIRVALRSMKLNIVEDDFGIAYSTTRYLLTQHQFQNKF